MAYRGAGVELRMPSAAAVRRYASKLAVETGQEAVTFDLPVSAIYPDTNRPQGREVSGWVRATRGPDGSWATRALGFPAAGPDAKARDYVAEAAQCVLDARRPSQALRDAGDLLERRNRRRGELGVKLAPTPLSTWVRQAGYDRSAEVLVISTSRGSYAYKVPERAYQAIAGSQSPGRAYNLLVRGKAQRVEVAECENCGRWSVKADGRGRHRCPPQEASRQAMATEGARAIAGIAGAALGFFAKRDSGA
jgi:hypothetical protein